MVLSLFLLCVVLIVYMRLYEGPNSSLHTSCEVLGGKFLLQTFVYLTVKTSWHTQSTFFSTVLHGWPEHQYNSFPTTTFILPLELKMYLVFANWYSEIRMYDGCWTKQLVFFSVPRKVSERSLHPLAAANWAVHQVIWWQPYYA